MKIYKTNILLLAGLALLLAGCGKDALPGHSIRVKVTTADTKGTVTTTDGLKASGAFSMMAYLSDDYNEYDSKGDIIHSYDLSSVNGKYFEESVTLGGSGWAINGEPTWISRVDTYFWAWHPVTVTGRSAPVPVKNTPVSGGPKYPYTGELTFSYTTPTVNGAGDADNAVDLLFAYTKKRYVNPEPPKTESDATVNITFHHALAQVRFCVSTNDGTFDKSLKIKSISISNLATSGNCSFTDSGNAENNGYAYEEDPAKHSQDKFVWTGQTGTATFGQTYNADFSTLTVSRWTKGSYTKDSHNYDLYTCENVFFMIPQTVTPTNKMTVVFEYKGDEITRTVDIADATGVEWLGDHYYTYKIKATTLGRDIDFAVSLVGWSNRKEEIFI